MTQKLSEWCCKFLLTSSLAISGANATFENCALTQITPDATLGGESSVVTPKVINGFPSDQIDGGARRGINLFHSFLEFNVSKDRGVYFTNPTGIENILTRVTGNNSSIILGKLGVLGGNANLFLISPNGIVFGPNASLDVGGSFVATTANAIEFSNQGFFNASVPNTPSLLTVNPSAFLFNQIAAGSIINNSREPVGEIVENISGIPEPLFGLKVPNSQSLLLVGGNVSLDSGGLNALGGQIELGGLAGPGTIKLDGNGNNLHLIFPNDAARADVFLTNGARVDASSDGGGGNIQLQSRSVVLDGGSQIIAVTNGSESGGILNLTASDSVELSGFVVNGTLATQTIGDGKAGDITINTGKLLIQDGAEVSTITRSKGAAGQLTVNAPESVELTGTSLNNADRSSGLFSYTTDAGDAGKITINTRRLFVQNRAVISTQSTYRTNSSGSQIITVATGRGGNLNVVAPETVQITDGALTTDTQTSADAGNINITTGILLVQNKGELIATSTGISDMLGNIILPATGKAGNLTVAARSIRLDTGGVLSAETVSGQGNINLDSQDLMLRHGSQISTTATGTAIGGNITIKTGVLTALESSNITADAQGGQGGNIHIKTQGLILSPDSSITAISERSPQLNGVVKTTTLVNNPSQGLVTLPVKPINITGQIAQGCPVGVGPRASKFVVTGRGGLPPDPTEALRSEPTLADLGTTVQNQENRTSATTSSKPTSSEPAPLVEAQGWVTNAKGEVVLVAQAPTATLHIPWLTPTTCQPTKTTS